MAPVTTAVLHPPPDRFPPGTNVSAYRGSAWSGTDKSGAPTGPAEAGPVAVAADGSLSFTGLTDNATYHAYAAGSGPAVLFSTRHDHADDTIGLIGDANVPAFAALKVVKAGDLMTNLGVTYRRIANGTTRASFDSTEAALWEAQGVSRKANALGINYRHLKAFYPEDYGVNVGGGGDDTAAWQACIDAAHTASSDVLIVAQAFYNLNSAPRHDRTGNAVLCFPPAGARTKTIHILTPDGIGTTFTTNVTGQAYSASFGPPSLIGGPTVEQTGVGPSLQFSQASIEWHGRVVLQLGANPTLAGLDMSGIVSGAVERLEVRGSFASQPTSTWCFGLRLPEGDNAAQVDVGYYQGAYVYAALVGNSAHIEGKNIHAYMCQLALGLTGNTQFAGNDGHSSHISYLDTERCVYHMAGWDPVAGVISLPAGKPAQLVVDLWDIEDAVAAQWYTTVAHVLDANHQIFGRAGFGRVVANTGRVVGYTVVGAGNFQIDDLNAGPSLPAGVAGDGSDGAVVLDGAATFNTFSGLAANVYTLTRDVFATSLVINAGVTLVPRGFRIFSRQPVVNNGTIADVGNDGTAAGVAGAATGAGVYTPGTAGGAGNVGPGTAGTAQGGGFGVGAGGAGGLGPSGAGGIGGTISNATITFVYRSLTVVLAAIMNFGGAARNFTGAAGGGGGGGDTTNKGGGGGGGGGLVVIVAPAVVNNGTISVKGGNGGTPTVGNAGGGGGGGGGAIAVYTMVPWTAGTTNVAGGTGGGQVGTGVAGTAGAVGSVRNIILA